MPYNTRRKSLSLPSLGIHLPNASRSSRLPPTPKAASTLDTQQPPSKKVKRSHESTFQSPLSVSSESQSSDSQKDKVDRSRPKSRRGTGTYEHTPPPSPADLGATTKIDTEGINDDIVVAVIEQLEKTGNRPHLIKELAAVLSTTNDSVANSANAAALLSSRLSLYLKRPWTALSPCPVAKELIPIHPRKVFFYLTTSPHQPLPEASDDILTPTTESKRITPSVSNASDDFDDDVDDDLARERARLSPSPEVDLSAPEFGEDVGDELDGHSAPGGSHATSNFGVRTNLSNIHNHRLAYNHRAISPPLEGDEKEFTQTASSVRERTSSEEVAARRRQDLGGDEAIQVSTVNGQDNSMGNNEVDMDDSAISHDEPNAQQNDYTDYFTNHILEDHVQEQDLDSAAATALFGASPSPSVSSELSSLSSVTSATSDGEAEAGLDTKYVADKDISIGLLKGENDVSATIGPGISAARIAVAQVGLLAGSKRSISALEAEEGTSTLEVDAREMDTDVRSSFDMMDSAEAIIQDKSGMAVDDTLGAINPIVDLDIRMDLGLESWNDLQSPETVEVDELDEIFGNI
ncbi:hypothetical protein FQN53_002234 [Emmonsiellopsis sp. PD_33]|nr:hypothetical protein FQN53_002234 [Emmonsiellopsis sp. PD_33]